MALPWPPGDPFPSYATMRAEQGNVFFDANAGAWLVLGYNAARRVMRGDGWSSDPSASEVVRARLAAMGVEPEMFGRMLLFLDPPDHTRVRAAVRSVFTPAAIGQLRERVAAIAAATIDPIPVDEPIDVMTDIARPLPVAVIAEWMDLGLDLAQLLWAESPALVRLLDFAPNATDLTAAAVSFTALMAHLLPLASDRRRRPGCDLLSVLATDPTLGLDEVVITALLIAVAGHETTANLIGNSLVTLCGRQGSQPAYIDGIGASLAPAVVDELLRLDGPVQAIARAATTDHEIGRHRIAAGDQVLVAIAAANRDPSVYDRPDRFDPGRTGPPPLAFGLGRHHCLGASLARLETSVALGQLLVRDPQLVDSTIRWRQTVTIRGPESLLVRLAA